MHNSAPANHHTSNKYFLLAFGLINILAFTLLFCTAGLLADAPVSIWQFPLAIICALLVNYYAVKFFNPGKQRRHTYPGYRLHNSCRLLLRCFFRWAMVSPGNSL